MGGLNDAERQSLDEAASRELPFLSVISLWEAQMLHAKECLKLTVPFEPWLLEAAGPGVVRLLPIDVAVILSLDRLPATFHGDPADRIIVSTARTRSLPMATYDRGIRRSRLVELWRP